MVSSSPSAGRMAFWRRPRAFALLAVTAVLAALAAVVLHQHCRGRMPLALETVPLAAAAMRVENGQCWIADLGTTWMSSHERPSRARLREDGKDLGPANALHDDIRKLGAGRFSLWNGSLYFSSSDGTSPAANGRRYEVVWPVPVSAALLLGLKAVAVLLALATAFGAARLWSERAQPWLHERFRGLGSLSELLAGRDPVSLSRIALAVGAVAVVARVIAIAIVHDDLANHITGFRVMGVPFSDAKGWDDLGESLTRGEGLAGGWSARRPFLGIAIGSLYLWTGAVPAAVVAMHVFLCGWTAALVCRLGQRVFHPLVGLVAGLAFALDPVSIDHTDALMTETLGTFLFVLSLDRAVAGVHESRASAWWWAGVTFALSNLTRTLTLPAAPLLALTALIGGRARGGTWRRGLVLATVFGIGVSLPLGAWLVRQKIVHDLWTISDNTASGLYGAAAPKYGSWNSAIDVEADDKGIPGDIKSRYEWFMQRFREELAANPGFYRDNVLRSARDGLLTLADVAPAVPWLLATLLFAVWLSRLPGMTARTWTLFVWLAVLFGGVYAVFALPRGGLQALASLGVVAAIVQRRDRLALLFFGVFAATIAAGAGFALCNDPRLLLMVSWMFPMALAYGVLFVVFTAARLLRDAAAKGALTAEAAPVHAAAWRTIGARALVVWFAVSLLVLAWRNFVSPLPPLPGLRNPTVAEGLEGVRRVAESLPGTISRAELAGPDAWYRQVEGPDQTPNHGKLVVANVRLSRHRYPLFANMQVKNHYSRMFVLRPYDRAFVYANACQLAGGAGGPGAIVLPAPLPPPDLRDLFVVARANIDRKFTYEENYVEVLAWAPLHADGTPDLSQLHVTSASAHVELVRSLAQ